MAAIFSLEFVDEPVNEIFTFDRVGDFRPEDITSDLDPLAYNVFVHATRMYSIAIKASKVCNEDIYIHNHRAIYIHSHKANGDTASMALIKDYAELMHSARKLRELAVKDTDEKATRQDLERRFSRSDERVKKAREICKKEDIACGQWRSDCEKAWRDLDRMAQQHQEQIAKLRILHSQKIAKISSHHIDALAANSVTDSFL